MIFKVKFLKTFEAKSNLPDGRLMTRIAEKGKVYLMEEFAAKFHVRKGNAEIVESGKISKLKEFVK
jgi:hypothetical protein